MQIRPADPGDLVTVAALFDGYRRFYDQPEDLPGCTAFVQQRFEVGDSYVLIALDESGTGMGFVQLYPTLSSVRMKPVWVLNDLYVAEFARGRGVASALMIAAVELARSAGVAVLTLETAGDNIAARALYEKLGWRRETEVEHYTLAL